MLTSIHRTYQINILLRFYAVTDMFAQQESSLLLIFRGMPKQVPAHTSLLFRGQTSLRWLPLAGTTGQGCSIQLTPCQFWSLTSQMQPAQKGGCYMVAAFWYSAACQWENGFGCGNWGSRFLLPRAFAALAGLGTVSTGSGLTGFLPIILLNIAVFYQTKNRICMNDYSMLKNFLNQSQVSGLDLAVASYCITFQNVLGC